MSADHERLLPPNEPAAFESLCLDLWREIWGGLGAQKNGRSGQPQAGVDVYGKTADGWVGVQCKQKDGLLRTELSVGELDAEVAKARTFVPALHRFIVATSGPRDGKVQERAREITDEGGFAVEVWSWEEIWHELYQRPELLRRIHRVYWPLDSALGVRRTSTTRLPRVTGELFGRDSELAALDAAWIDPKVHVVTLVAWGGVGKTSLVAKWVAGLVARDHDGADYFDWSFYSQGTRDQGSASADPFVDAALRFFGDEATADSARSPWDKGSRLAQLVAERRTLLVLDGLEPLQHPPGPLAGELKDPAMTALLKGLAARNPGLCVVTTRERVTDLAGFEGSTAPRWALEHLSPAAGVALLKAVGVHGAAVELEKLVEDVKGHALTLNLLGRFLSRAHGGDVRRRDRVNLGRADLKVQGGHAFKTIAAYEGWLATGGEAGQIQLAVLRLLGLFDRPADGALIAALRRPPRIEHLTELLVELEEDDWNVALDELADSRLITVSGTTLDAHPLIREHFGRQLREQHPEAWKAAHGRLFDHLKDTTERWPDTLAGLQPLYQAVVHGCQAGRQQEACAEVYDDRILRGTGDDGFYSTNKLGAFGADLGAVACFFEPPWSRVSPSLAETDHAWLLNEAATRLRGLGRLTEAVEPMRAVLRVVVEDKRWKEAAISTTNLNELELTLGDVAGAVRDAEQSVVFADRSGDEFWRMASRAKVADALHQAGHRDDALARFREAEAMQAEQQPQYPLLYSLRGFQYCDLLLADAERAAIGGRRAAGAPRECGEVERRAARGLAIGASNQWVLDVALDHLTLGRAQLYRAILEGSALDDAKVEIDQAVDGLRRAGTLDHVPRGLLTRAWLRSALDDSEGARDDLAEAQEIAERGPMPLFLADVHLYRARFFHDRVALAEARRLVVKHGYGRRLGELEDLEAMAGGW